MQASDEPAMSDIAFPGLLQEAIARRPEVVMAAKSTALARQQQTLARSGELPSVVLSAGSNYDLLHQYDKYLTSYVSAEVDMPLFDGGMTKGRIEQAKADFNSAKINEDNVREAIALEVRQASLSVQNNRDQDHHGDDGPTGSRRVPARLASALQSRRGRPA